MTTEKIPEVPTEEVLTETDTSPTPYPFYTNPHHPEHQHYPYHFRDAHHQFRRRNRQEMKKRHNINSHQQLLAILYQTYKQEIQQTLHPRQKQEESKTEAVEQEILQTMEHKVPGLSEALQRLTTGGWSTQDLKTVEHAMNNPPHPITYTQKTFLWNPEEEAIPIDEEEVKQKEKENPYHNVIHTHILYSGHALLHLLIMSKFFTTTDNHT